MKFDPPTSTAQEAALPASLLWTRPWTRTRGLLMHCRCNATVAMVCFLAAHFGWLAAHHVASSVGPDAHDYLLAGRLLSEQHNSGIAVGSPLSFVGQQWFPARDAQYHSVHDMGFPLLLAVVRSLLGGSATLWVNPLLISLALLGFFLWLRRHASAWLALGGMIILAFQPAWNQSTGYGDSHPFTVFCIAWALMLADQREDGRHQIRALLAGALLGMIPVIRSADALVAVALGSILVGRTLLNQQTGRGQRWSFLLWLASGALVPLAALMLHNWSCFGAPWKTAYSDFGGQSIFATKYIARNAADMAKLFGTGSHAFLMWSGVVALIFILIRRENLWLTALIAMGLLGNLAVYLPFYWPVEQTNDRFFMPAYMLMAAAVVLGLQSAAKMGTRAAAVMTCFVVVAMAGTGALASQKRMDELTLRDEVMRDGMALVMQKVPQGAVIISDYALAQEADAEGGWRVVDLGHLVPPQLRGIHPRSGDQAKPISRRSMGADDWMRSMTSMPVARFDEKALPELKSLANGKDFYVLALPNEWEGLARRWNGNWTLLGSISLPVEQPEGSKPADPGRTAPVGPHPLDPGKLYDVHLDGKSLDLVQAHLW